MSPAPIALDDPADAGSVPDELLGEVRGPMVSAAERESEAR
jgi:hypothetical protein